MSVGRRPLIRLKARSGWSVRLPRCHDGVVLNPQIPETKNYREWSHEQDDHCGRCGAAVRSQQHGLGAARGARASVRCRVSLGRQWRPFDTRKSAASARHPWRAGSCSQPGTATHARPTTGSCAEPAARAHTAAPAFASGALAQPAASASPCPVATGTHAPAVTFLPVAWQWRHDPRHAAPAAACVRAVPAARAYAYAYAEPRSDAKPGAVAQPVACADPGARPHPAGT